MKLNMRFVALVVAGAMVAGTVGLSASAQAAEITPVGTITITPSSGNVNTDVYFLDSIAVNTGAPVGFRASSGTFVYQGGVELGAIASARNPSMVSTAGTNGLDGNPVFMDRSIIPTNNFVSNKLLNATTVPLATGAFELRYYYFASATAPNRATDPYVKLDMTYNATTGAWGLPAVVVPAIATTTSLTASATGTTVALGATVKAGTSVATASAGTVAFFEGATQVGTTQTVAAGLASVSLTGVAVGTHSYTATFTPSNTAYLASTSASASIGALIAPIETAAVPVAITFDIAAGTNGGVLQLTSRSSNVALGTATIGGGTFNASGTLNAVVDDSRQAGSPDWNLTGVMGDFTAGTKTLSGKYLGWSPAVTAGSVGSAGAVVLPAPGSPNGLKTSSQLSYGSTSAADPQVTTTTVSALLQLKAPRNTAAGNYAGVLTLTLI